MNILEEQKIKTAFHSLSPEIVITLAEDSLGVQCSNLCRPLASYINRVFELEQKDGTGIVVKFYRPGRWSKNALQDEHEFLLELTEHEIPVIAPLPLVKSMTIGHHEDIHFAIFPKKGGRSFDEYNDDQWLELGRLLGRTHAVGCGRKPQDRVTLAPDQSTTDQVNFLLQGNFIPSDLAKQFKDISKSIINAIGPLFENIEMIRIHGDCHFANLIYRPEESFFLIDFDDMATGPPVQDFWMLLPGYRNEVLAEIEIFLEGYETFRTFDMKTLQLIEPLRAMRYIHYIAWCAHQVAEDGFSHVAPDFGSEAYWIREINDLTDQLVRIKETL
jgi:Ser/Thr protein kinase RdoA (MazF antagonist)